MIFLLMERKRKYRLRFIKKPHLVYSIPIFFFFFFFFLISISALFCSTISFTTTSPGSFSLSNAEIRRLLSAKADTYFQEPETDKIMVMSKEVKEEVMPNLMSPARRYLGGLGSSPPRCLWKCGKCTPCKPVHVPVPPGTPVTAEYYPEAWRCKCGNKLYMP